MILIFALSLLINSLSARKLDFKEHPFGFEISGGLTDTPTLVHLPYYEGLLGNTQKFTYNGAYNLFYNFENTFTLKLGIEAIYFPKLNGIEGSNFTASSLYYAYAPNIAFELIFYSSNNIRAFFGSKFLQGYFSGSSKITHSDPTYTDYTLKLSDTAYGFEPFIACEFSLVDKYSIVFSAFYKNLVFNNVKVSRNISDSNSVSFSKNKDFDAVYIFSGFGLNLILRLYI